MQRVFAVEERCGEKEAVDSSGGGLLHIWPGALLTRPSDLLVLLHLLDCHSFSNGATDVLACC